MALNFALEMDRLADANGRQKATELVAHLGEVVPNVYVIVAQRAFMQMARKALTDTVIVGDIDRRIRRLVERWDFAFAMEMKEKFAAQLTGQSPVSFLTQP